MKLKRENSEEQSIPLEIDNSADSEKTDSNIKMLSWKEIEEYTNGIILRDNLESVTAEVDKEISLTDDLELTTTEIDKFIDILKQDEIDMGYDKVEKTINPTEVDDYKVIFSVLKQIGVEFASAESKETGDEIKKEIPKEEMSQKEKSAFREFLASINNMKGDSSSDTITITDGKKVFEINKGELPDDIQEIFEKAKGSFVEETKEEPQEESEEELENELEEEDIKNTIINEESSLKNINNLRKQLKRISSKKSNSIFLLESKLNKLKKKII